MPNWGEHLLIANKLLKRIRVDENLFLFGNILPDVQDGFLVKEISNILPHEVNHYDRKGEKSGYQNFFDLYQNKLDNPMILGYLSHLMTDYLWNHMFYDEKCLKNNDEIIGYINKNGKMIKRTKEQARKDKQKDYEAFQYYIYKKYDMKLPGYDDEISRNANFIETVNINNQDVKNVVEYIREKKESADNEDCETKIYTTEELEMQIDKTVDFIYKFLKENGEKICI